MDPNWINRPFGIMGHVFDYWLLPDDPAEQVKIKLDMGFVAEHWFGGRFKTGGDNGRSWLFRTRHGFIEDRLGPYMAAARAGGLKVLVYVNAHWYSKDFPAEMFARNADGSLITAYGSGSLTCPAGPFLKYSLELAEDLGEYDIDGVFLDGPIAGSCWCESCRGEFARKYGRDMPAGRLSLADRRLMEEWTAWKVAHYVGEFRQTLRAKRPGAIVYHNGSTLGRVTWGNRATVERCDMLGAEGGFIGYSPLEGQFLYKTAATAKLIDAVAGGKPTVLFNDHAFKKYDYWPLPRAEIDLLWAATLAGGANPWFVIYASNFGTHAADAARYWNGFINSNNDALAGTRAAESVALLWSDATALVSASAMEEEDSVHGGGEAHGAKAGVAPARKVHADYRGAFTAAYSLLARSAIPFRIVTERELGSLDGVAVLVAPSTVALDDASFAAIEKFVHAGGTLIADDEFAVMDELGVPRDAGRIQALLGASTTGEIPAAAENIDYFQVSHGKVAGAAKVAGATKLAKGLSTAPIPRPTHAFATILAGGKAMAHFYRPLAGRYDELPPVSDAPAVIRHTAGEGQVIYMPMVLFEHYGAFCFEDHRRLVANAIALCHALPVSVDGLDGRGEALIRRSEKSDGGGRLLVHLLNYNGSIRPFAGIAPLNGVRIAIRLDSNDRNPQSAIRNPQSITARALHAGKDLPVRRTSRGWVIRLGRLGVAETVVVEMKEGV
ncbi:MAG: hypothetical protein ACE15C_08395 [Phycisphaerae bacterium]